ncbi:MAG: hypothetical protein FWH28_07355 [Clostridiales bacterium]|nr:hypothetical protein [Clostridiales bacterium]
MRRKRLIVILCTILLCSALLSGIAHGFAIQPTATFAQAAGESPIAKAAAAFRASEPILTALRDAVASELESADDDAEEEFEVSLVQDLLAELDDYSKQLETLSSGLDGLPDREDSNEEKTVRAVKEYLTMLWNMTADIRELAAYSLDLYHALILFGDIDAEAEGYEALAESIYTVTGESAELLAKIAPPAYLDITHNELESRVRDFHEFALDFYLGAELGDPLRIYSCINRMSRLEIMFNRCAENLNEDILLQFTQADRRLKGPIATLHGELTQNLSLLGAS